MNDRITALEQALEPFALISSEGVVKAGSTGHVTITTVAEYFHEAAYALAASRAAPDCQQPDLVTAAQVRVKPLVWIKSGAASQFGNYIVTCEDHGDRTVWFVMFGGKVLAKCGEHDSEASAKAAAQADYEARIISALDLTPAPAAAVEIDIRSVFMQEIEKAAASSPWVPPEYTMNEVVSDCCTFLRTPRAQDAARVLIRQAGISLAMQKPVDYDHLT